jgi:integral membrane sensor domain MASE1
MILLLVGAWFHVNVCGAEQTQQSTPEEVTPPSRESSENPCLTKVEENMKEVFRFLVTAPLVPVVVGLSAGFMVIYLITGNPKFNPIPK